MSIYRTDEFDIRWQLAVKEQTKNGLSFIRKGVFFDPKKWKKSFFYRLRITWELYKTVTENAPSFIFSEQLDRVYHERKLELSQVNPLPPSRIPHAEYASDLDQKE